MQTTDAEGIPAFLIPVLSDDVDMLRTFLASGVSANHATEKGGVTALMVAAAKGSKALVDSLIDEGADLDRRMDSGEPFSHIQGALILKCPLWVVPLMPCIGSLRATC